MIYTEAPCRWCPLGCPQCEPEDCECYTHQDEPDKAVEELRRTATDAHRHLRVPGGYVACACGEDWADHRQHVAEKLAEVGLTGPLATARPEAGG